MFLLGATPVPSHRTAPIELLQVGSFHAGEVDPNSAGVWFGLFQTSGGFELREVRVKVDTGRDVIVDEGSARTGKIVSLEGGAANSAGTPIVLVRGVTGMSPGPVNTLIPGHRFFYPGEHVSFELAKNYWAALTAYGNVDRPPDSQPGSTRIYAYKLVLSVSPWGEENQQEIMNVHGMSEDSPPSVIWAGDLDRDGRLDLIAEIGNHYNVTETALFLSSAAPSGKLVELVARFRSVGC